MRRTALLTASAFIGLASIVAAGTTASASARASIAPKAAAVSTFTLNLVGTPIVVGVTTDPAGNLVDATIDPAAGFTATTVQPHKVKFENSTAGTTVSVKANHGGQSVSARAAKLADVSGPGIWSGDVFGDGTTTTVNFAIGTLVADPTAPDITGVTVLPAGCTSAVAPDFSCVISPTTYGHDDDDNEGTEASAAVKFSSHGQSRSLRIRVGTHTEDGVTSAAVRISLSKIKGTLDDGKPVVGDHTYTATLCDGTTSLISYAVAADGTITVTPLDPQVVKTGEHGDARVSFPTGETFRISVKSEDSSAMKISIKASLHCKAPLPTVNSTVVPAIGGQGGHGDQGGHGGDHGGNNNGGGDNKGND